MGQRPAGLPGTLVPRHPDASDLGNSMDVASFPPALAAEGLEPVARDVHRHRVAVVVIRAAERQRQQMVDLEGAIDRLLAVPANPVAGLEDALADEYQANNDRGRRSLIARFWALFPELRGGKAGREVRRLARRWGRALLERERRQPLGARPVEVLEFAAAAGDGSVADLVPQASVVWFRRDWLQRLGLDPTQCAVLRAQGESMEPTIAAGSSILIDRSRTRRRDGQIFVLRTAEGMVVKRTARGENGGWQLASGHPAWEPVAFRNDTVILGRIVWTARALV